MVDELRRGGAPGGGTGAMLADSLRAAGKGRPTALIAPNVLNKYPHSVDVIEGVLRSAAEELGGSVSAVSRGVDQADKQWVKVEIAY